MSDLNTLTNIHQTGSTARASSGTGTGTVKASDASQVESLRPGMQVQLIPERMVADNVMEARLQGAQGMTPTVRAQLASPLPEQLAAQLAAPGSASPTRPGLTPLLAEVVSVSPQLVLRLIGAADGSSLPLLGQAAAPGSRDWIGLQLRHHWPGAQPLASTLEDLVNRLGKLEGGTPSTLTADAKLDAAIQQSVERLVTQLASDKDLAHADRLSTAILKSGIWLEAAAAQAAAGPMAGAGVGNDLKAQLLYLARRLRSITAADQTSPSPGRSSRTDSPDSRTRLPAEPAVYKRPGVAQPQQTRLLTAPTADGAGQPASPSTDASPDTRGAPPPPTDHKLLGSLIKDVDGMIKQIVTNQLQALDPAQSPHWVLEIPFRTSSGLTALEADIRREPRAEPDDEDTWSMRLNLDLPRLGPLTIKLSLRSERLSASLQAIGEDSATALTQNLDKLRTQLESRDIEVASLHAGQRAREPRPPPFDAPLLSEEA